MDLGLDGRTALVTGGGIGSTLAPEGAKHGVIGGVDLFTF